MNKPWYRNTYNMRYTSFKCSYNKKNYPDLISYIDQHEFLLEGIFHYYFNGEGKMDMSKQVKHLCLYLKEKDCINFISLVISPDPAIKLLTAI